ncbi:hypothetical protein [Dactylosporangium darangshiense]|uniref:hypothetical protein n=1 Tax=Dactylosporangium darangshiense TaxID=579108 RepID=UPI0031E78E70
MSDPQRDEFETEVRHGVPVQFRAVAGVASAQSCTENVAVRRWFGAADQCWSLVEPLGDLFGVEQWLRSRPTSRRREVSVSAPPVADAGAAHLRISGDLRQRDC